MGSLVGDLAHEWERSMRNLLLSVMLIVLAAPAYAQNSPPNKPPSNNGKGNTNAPILASIVAASSKPQCNSASPTHPCKGNNGFGNGGGDGSPNGKQDDTR